MKTRLRRKEWQVKIGTVHKDGVARVGNPYTPGLPVGGEGHTVLKALDYLYTVRDHKVFEGSIEDQIREAGKARISEEYVRAGFRELEQEGYIRIEGDVFIPLQPLLDRYA